MLLHPADLPVWELTHADPPDGELSDGQQIVVAGTVLRVLHTPGHSPGSVCFYVPALGTVFSGDTLFQGGPGATGRSFSDPDLIVRSITERLLTLPSATVEDPGRTHHRGEAAELTGSAGSLRPAPLFDRCVATAAVHFDRPASIRASPPAMVRVGRCVRSVRQPRHRNGLARGGDGCDRVQPIRRRQSRLTRKPAASGPARGRWRRSRGLRDHAGVRRRGLTQRADAAHRASVTPAAAPRRLGERAGRGRSSGPRSDSAAAGSPAPPGRAGTDRSWETRVTRPVSCGGHWRTARRRRPRTGSTPNTPSRPAHRSPWPPRPCPLPTPPVGFRRHQIPVVAVDLK